MAYKNFKMTEIIDELGTELRKVRNTQELTLAQVADALKKNGTHISSIMLGRIETGQRRIDDDLFHALCNHYLVNPEEIVIKACQTHITALQQTEDSKDRQNDALWIAEAYNSLPPNRQADIRTMMRMFSYMDKFSKLDS